MLELNISWSCESSGIPHILFRHGPVTVTTMSPGNAPLLGQHGGLLIQEDATLTATIGADLHEVHEEWKSTDSVWSRLLWEIKACTGLGQTLCSKVSVLQCAHS